jgi:broad specificity phosphatase PhoE
MMPGSRLLLVRHGETVGNSSVRYYGRTDLPLSELGRAQMRSAARWLRSKFGDHFEPVFTSPLARAIESARIISGPDAALIQVADFVEVDFGLFEGLTADEISERYPEEFQRWNRGRLGPDYVYPGGEGRAAFSARVDRGLERAIAILNASARADNALLVAHRGVIRAITQRLVDQSPDIEIGSIQVLRGDRRTGEWQAEMLDVNEHL